MGRVGLLSCKSLLPVGYNDLRSFVKSNFRDFANVNIAFCGTRYLTPRFDSIKLLVISSRKLMIKSTNIVVSNNNEIRLT